jgi:hypothetical protein
MVQIFQTKIKSVMISCKDRWLQIKSMFTSIQCAIALPTMFLAKKEM